MAFLNKINNRITEKKIEREAKEEKKTQGTVYEPLKFCAVIVNRGQGVAIHNIFMDAGAAATVLSHAEGAKEKYVMDIIGGDDQFKDVVFCLLPKSKYPKLVELISNRFKVSRTAKGVMFTIDVKSMAGLLAYKYLSDYAGVLKYAKK